MRSKKDRQVYSSRGTSFLTLSGSYTDELANKPADGEEAVHEAPLRGGAKPKTNRIKAQPPETPVAPPPKPTLGDRLAGVKDNLKSIQQRASLIADKVAQRVDRVTQKVVGVATRMGQAIAKPFMPLVTQIKSAFKRSQSEEAFEDDEAVDEAPTPPVSFVALAEKNIIFTDNRKVPLYTAEQMIGKNGYSVSEAVVRPLIMEKILEAFQEVAPKAKAIPTPDKGLYAGRSMDDVMENLGEEDIDRFLSYVIKFPVGYAGKRYRITESFAGWVVSGTPDD